ncbi:MAG: DMT family transporter [Hyphomicrobiales bacterium]|nr:DMT family transporter [Hyphomicrobiales bacterium]
MSAPASTDPRAIAAAALVGVQVGAAAVASRFALAEIDPVLLGLLRYMVGVCCLLPFLAMRGGLPRFAPRDLAPMCILGIVQFALLIWLFNVALTHMPAARVSLVFSAFPLLTMLFAAALGRERLTPMRAGGVLLTMAGVALVLGERAAPEQRTAAGSVRPQHSALPPAARSARCSTGLISTAIRHCR